MWTDRWILILTAICAIGAFFGVLSYFGITPDVVRRRTMIKATSSLWISLAAIVLVGTFVLSGYGLYRTFQAPPTRWTNLVVNQMQIVKDKQFINESVEIDGKNFVNCRFVDVTLVFHGRKTYLLQNNIWGGKIIIKTDDDPAAEAMRLEASLLQVVGLIAPVNVVLDTNSNLLILPNPKK